MAKEEKNYQQEFKKINLLLYIIMFLLIAIFILFLVNSCTKESSNTKYDTSMMREVSVEDTLNLFNSNDTYVLYIGRETCDICVDLLPTLKNAQIENNYITQYLDISKVDRSTDNWQKLVNLLNVETTTTMNDEVVTNTFGYFLNEKGFTPCVIIISNNHQVAGFFGDKDLTSLEDWLANYGI